MCKDPERFLPERFIEGAVEHEEGVYKKWFPFGDGVRACIGARFALMVLLHCHSIATLCMLLFSSRLFCYSMKVKKARMCRLAGGQGDTGADVSALHI